MNIINQYFSGTDALSYGPITYSSSWVISTNAISADSSTSGYAL